MYVKTRNGNILKYNFKKRYRVIEDNACEDIWDRTGDLLFLLYPTGNYNSPLEHRGGNLGKGFDIVEILEDYIER